MNIKSILILSSVFFTIGCANKVPNEAGNVNASTSSKWTYLDNEIKPEFSYTCFQGAYYRKTVSSRDHWIGIKGEVTLPTIKFDESRKNSAKPGQYLDNPSVYMGGHMDGQETDIGLTWEVIKHEDGSVSKERLAFRPFFRRTDHKSGQKDVWIYAPAKKEFYWYPGEKVEMSVEVVKDGLVKISVKGAGKHFEETYECAGYTLNGIGDFKRVNAIDQVRNEGKPAQPTQTKVSDAKWSYTTLIRMQNGKRLEVPMHAGRFTNMRCPDVKFFEVNQSSKEAKVGAEEITISGIGF